MKRNYTYHINLELTSYNEGNKPEEITASEFEFTNHDNIFSIIVKLKEKQLFESDSDATEFGLGLKLFSEVMLQNRDHELFREFAPEFRAFMKKLKAS